jgi:hypothetical protein
MFDAPTTVHEMHDCLIDRQTNDFISWGDITVFEDTFEHGLQGLVNPFVIPSWLSVFSESDGFKKILRLI